MNRVHPFRRHHTSRLARKVIGVGLCIWAGGFSAALVAAPQLATPPLLAPAAAASAQVPLEQQPLRVRAPIPPNIVLMLDDSGSMRWDIMPDWDYLPAPNWHDLRGKSNWRYTDPASIEPLIDPAINGVYYNPAITYTAPPKADGSFYPNGDFDDALVNGFDTSATPTRVDLSTYRGTDDTNTVRYEASSVQYSIAVKTGAASYAPSASCPSGWDASTRYPGYCSDDGNPSGWVSFYDSTNGYFYKSRCNSVSDVYENPDGDDHDNPNDDVCYPGISFFTYVLTDANGNFVRHYVGDEGDCAAAGMGSDPVCVDSASARQNVANWFSYYHTRILLAKTGLMEAFASVNPKYRVGFGSINNSAATYIRTLDHAYKENLDIANVDPFGDGSAGSQKANFWKWVIAVTPNGSTPLRKALRAVGEYYQEDQPWASTNAVTGDTDYLACRQSYTILTTDGFWNGDSPNVGDNDDNAGEQITGPRNAPYTYTPVAPFTDGPSGGNRSNTLADVAMQYWMTDLKSDIANEVPTNSADPAFWQHMVTFTMGLGFTPSDAADNPIDSTVVQGLFDWANTGTKPASLSDWGGWPVPSSNSINNIADLVHAGVDGHGGFYSATDPRSFVGGLKSALQRAQQRVGTGASAATKSTQLAAGNVVYQGFYQASDWSGQLKAFAIDPATGAILTSPLKDPVTGDTLVPAPLWNAATAMPAASDRNIHTYAPAAGAWTAGPITDVAFKNSGTAPPTGLSAAELAALGSTAANQAAMVNYLRGDNSQDQTNGGPYRNRSSGLGDIVDSAPVYVGTPGASLFSGESFTGSDSYATFASDHSGRTALIYVAGNDGMVHAFNAGTCTAFHDGSCAAVSAGAGKEVYAFLPADVITHGGVDGAGNIVGVSELASPDYGSDTAPHQYFNDGQLASANAYFDGAWHTVLVGTTGRGLAKAVYALDITDPANIKILWERSAWDGGANSGYIGQVTGTPVIVQVADGKWAVLLGNGYNSPDGVAALLQFKLSDGTLTVHKTTDTTTANGLAAPAVWISDPSNGFSTMAYAGDLRGQVWSFQLTQVTVVGNTATYTSTPSSTGVKLFTARDSQNNRQPITSGLLVGRDPGTSNRWVFFGTGRYLSADDITDTSVQTWYGLIVQSSSNPDLVTNLANGRSALAQRFIIAQAAEEPGTGLIGARVVSPANDPDTQPIGGKSGWYMDLETPGMDGEGDATDYNNPVPEGERMIVPNQFRDGLLIGTTAVPTSSDLCNPSGIGAVMAIEPFTGTNPRAQFFDVNGDGLINNGDMVTVNGKSYAAAGVVFPSLPNAPIYVTGTSGSHQIVTFGTGGNDSRRAGLVGNLLKRVSWREMVNP